MKSAKKTKIIGYVLSASACIAVLYLTSLMQEPTTPQIFESVMNFYAGQTYAQNAVTSIYLNYRIYDTIFEALMLLICVIGVIHFSRHEHNIVLHNVKSKTIISNIALIVPAIIILGMYIIANGHLTPGGGFQGGAALSAAFICVYLVNPNKTIDIHSYEQLEKYLFLTLAILALIFAVSNLYLDYSIHNPIYLVTMNVLIGLKVFLGLSVVFFRFVHYEDA